MFRTKHKLKLSILFDISYNSQSFAQNVFFCNYQYNLFLEKLIYTIEFKSVFVIWMIETSSGNFVNQCSYSISMFIFMFNSWTPATVRQGRIQGGAGYLRLAPWTIKYGLRGAVCTHVLKLAGSFSKFNYIGKF